MFPEAPTGVGFCLYITREVPPPEIGGFDEAAFGRGDGEDKSTTLGPAIAAAGFSNLIADHTFVYHQGSASFGDSAGASERQSQCGHDASSALSPGRRPILCLAPTR